jgi:hypothetical protein
MIIQLPSMLSLWMVFLAVAGSGCAAMRPGPVPSNPLFVRTSQHELVWERSVDVLHHNLFEIESENRLDGMIETKYKTAAGLLEPWHPDSPGLDNRLEATLQSLRRKAFIAITPAEGGYLVSVEAYKELEDVASAANSAGAATFLDNNARKRDLEPLIGQSTPSGWIPKGRDMELERLLLEDLYAAFNK